jgi:SAM-dependent methyltransferase
VAGNVLDIGGSQLPMEKSRVKSWDVKEIKILDMQKPHACIKFPDIIADLNKEPDGEYLGNFNYYDIAFCLEVSEYLWNPVRAISNIANLLKQGGILYMSFHFITPIHGPLGEDYLRYTKWGVQKIMHEAGFEIKDIVMRDTKEGNLLMDFFKRERMRPMNNYKHHNETGYLVKAIKV